MNGDTYYNTRAREPGRAGRHDHHVQRHPRRQSRLHQHQSEDLRQRHRHLRRRRRGPGQPLGLDDQLHAQLRPSRRPAAGPISAPGSPAASPRSAGRCTSRSRGRPSAATPTRATACSPRSTRASCARTTTARRGRTPGARSRPPTVKRRRGVRKLQRYKAMFPDQTFPAPFFIQYGPGQQRQTAGRRQRQVPLRGVERRLRLQRQLAAPGAGAAGPDPDRQARGSSTTARSTASRSGRARRPARPASCQRADRLSQPAIQYVPNLDGGRVRDDHVLLRRAAQHVPLDPGKPVHPVRDLHLAEAVGTLDAGVGAQLAAQPVVRRRSVPAHPAAGLDARSTSARPTTGPATTTRRWCRSSCSASR